MSTYGITPAGFVKKPYTVILSELEDAARTKFGQDVDLSQFSPIGIFVQLMADQKREDWDNLEDLYYGIYIDDAEGSTLDRVAALGGLSRRPATRSVVTLTISGTNGTNVPVGFTAQTPQGIEFITTESGTISGGSVDLESRAIEAGTAGNVSAGTITEITSPQSGVDSVTNAAGAVGGADIETDPELRQRYKDRGVAGGSTAVAIQAVLNNIETVVTAVCYENNTDGTVDGMPPHSIECVIDGGTEQEILEALLNNKPAGIETHGGESGQIVDSAGVTRTFKWSEPTFQDVYVDVDITPDAEWEAGFIDAVKQKVVEEVGGTYDSVDYPGQGIGVDVLSWRIIAALDSLVGIENVQVRVGEAADPADTKVDIERAERAQTDETKIVVTVL